MKRLKMRIAVWTFFLTGIIGGLCDVPVDALALRAAGAALVAYLLAGIAVEILVRVLADSVLAARARAPREDKP